MEITELVQHRTVNDTRQSCWTVRRTFQVGEHKVRATVANDSYQFQCDYYVEVFSPATLSWNRVHTEPDSWQDSVGALSTGHLTPEKWDDIDMLIDQMVRIAADLL